MRALIVICLLLSILGTVYADERAAQATNNPSTSTVVLREFTQGQQEQIEAYVTQALKSQQPVQEERDWWPIIGSSIICPILLYLVFLSAEQFHIRERVEEYPTEGTKVITFIPRYEFVSNDARVASAVTHTSSAIVIGLTWIFLAFF